MYIFMRTTGVYSYMYIGNSGFWFILLFFPYSIPSPSSSVPSLLHFPSILIVYPLFFPPLFWTSSAYQRKNSTFEFLVLAHYTLLDSLRFQNLLANAINFFFVMTEEYSIVCACMHTNMCACMWDVHICICMYHIAFFLAIHLLKGTSAVFLAWLFWIVPL